MALNHSHKGKVRAVGASAHVVVSQWLEVGRPATFHALVCGGGTDRPEAERESGASVATAATV
jgi:hypothetical protein